MCRDFFLFLILTGSLYIEITVEYWLNSGTRQGCEELMVRVCQLWSQLLNTAL